MLSKSQIASGEHETRSLKELFEFTDDCSYFLTEEAFSDVSQPDTKASTQPLMSLGEQACGSAAIPVLDILDPDDPSITSLPDYLSSDTGKNEMDRFDDDFFLIGT